MSGILIIFRLIYIFKENSKFQKVRLKKVKIHINKHFIFNTKCFKSMNQKKKFFKEIHSLNQIFQRKLLIKRQLDHLVPYLAQIFQNLADFCFQRFNLLLLHKYKQINFSNLECRYLYSRLYNISFYIQILTAMPVQAFTSTIDNASILRVYSLRLSYQYCRQLDRDKSISSGLASHCIIIRQKPIVNKTDFGYKQELKTNVLKKMHFVYLQKIQDLFAFLYEHIKYLEEHVHQPSLAKSFMKSEPVQKASPLFGMLLIESIQAYFGNVVNYQNMGPKIFIFLKLLKQLDNLMPFNSNLCFTYGYNPNICKYEDFLSFIKSDGLTCWRVSSLKLQKNGFNYESQWSRKFYQLYVLDENHQEETDQRQKTNKA